MHNSGYSVNNHDYFSFLLPIFSVFVFETKLSRILAHCSTADIHGYSVKHPSVTQSKYQLSKFNN